MPLHFRIPSGLKVHFDEEILLAQSAWSAGEWQRSWRHLERAHILGQAWPWEHTYSHWKMLGFAIRIKNGKEILGQLPRLLVGGVKSFVGEIPLGNTGGANVPPLRRMEIPEDLKAILDRFEPSV